MNNVIKDDPPTGYFEIYQKKKLRESKNKKHSIRSNNLPVITINNSKQKDYKKHKYSNSLGNKDTNCWKEESYPEVDLMESDVNSEGEQQAANDESQNPDPDYCLLKPVKELTLSKQEFKVNIRSDESSDQDLKAKLLSKSNISAQKFQFKKQSIKSKPKKKMKKLGFYMPKNEKIKAVVIPKCRRSVKHIEQIDITHKRHRKQNLQKQSQIFW
jgi:archaellin